MSRQPPHRSGARPVVVGVDGSRASHEALRLGVDEARARNTRVRAVHVWHVAEGEYLAGFPPTTESVEEAHERARRVLNESVAGSSADPAVVVEPVLVESESAAASLIAESEHAALLVVGTRGLGGLKELLLGSVSHACCQHARCPVLVVPAGAYEEPAPVGLDAGSRRSQL